MVTDLEKRLQLLRRQVYGREPVSSIKYQVSKSEKTLGNTRIADISYLRQDLLKILIFSSIAIGTQFILFFLLKNQLLRINIL